MIFQLLLPLFLLQSPTEHPQHCTGSLNDTPRDSIAFYDGFLFDVIGKYHNEKHYGRFPQRYKDILREKVWTLGECSAGMGIRFHTNASTIVVRWTVKKDAQLPHMPSTGVKGVDLYAFVGGEWQYVKTGFPSDHTTESILLSDGDGTAREYLLNLPLYDGVDSLEIGVNLTAEISPAHEKRLLDKKAIVYYGTSIAQGGCASRPGLAFTNILSRKLDRAIVNFGFSGNGTIETSVGQAMAEIDAALYVIDCNPNTKAELIYDRTIELVRMLKNQRPDVPLLLVEGFLNESNYLNPASGVNTGVRKKNQELKRAWKTLKDSGITKIYYRTNDGLVGNDHEGTVDGIHPNDIGMMRIAGALYPTLKKIL